MRLPKQNDKGEGFIVNCSQTKLGTIKIFTKHPTLRIQHPMLPQRCILVTVLYWTTLCLLTLLKSVVNVLNIIICTE